MGSFTLEEPMLWPRTRVLTIDANSVVYAAKGYCIYRSEDWGGSWTLDGKLRTSAVLRLSSGSRLLHRLVRGGIHGVVVLSGGKRLCIGPGVLAAAPAGGDVYEPTFRIRRGSRPLNVCVASDGKIYWGEYFDNRRRGEVYIYCSDDAGISWDVCHAFPANSVRHVHRIVFDRYDDSILVCTGDENNECGIYRTADSFRTLDLLGSGRQIYRTTTLIPATDCILYATDAPLEQNYIMRLERGSDKPVRVHELPGPVISSSKIQEKLVVSVMAEGALENAELWASADFEKWERITSFRKDRWPERYFQYGACFLPEGEAQGPHLFCTPVAVRGFDQMMVRWRFS